MMAENSEKTRDLVISFHTRDHVIDESQQMTHYKHQDKYRYAIDKQHCMN